LFALAIGHGHQTSRSIHATNRVVQQYLASLRSTDLDDVPVLELLHTLFSDVPSASTATLYKLLDISDFATGLYRDAAGTLVIRHSDTAGPRLSLLWPVGHLPGRSTENAAIVGQQGNVFLEGDDPSDIVPLPAASAGRCVYGWGSTGPEVVNLYLAIVYTVCGVQAPPPRPHLRDHADSLYGWLVRKDSDRELRISRTDLIRLVRADEPLRLAAKQSMNRPTSPSAQATKAPPRFATARNATIRP
jgi:hypothetical protein